MGELVESETHLLWIVSATLIVTGYMAWIKTFKPEWMLALISILCIMGVELAARFFINTIFPAQRPMLAELVNRTYPHLRAYVGHPFLQFTGTPSIAVQGNSSLGELPPFNSMGFLGNDFHYDKPDSVVRIACLGGSTTARGYPRIMEKYINGHNPDPSIRYEALNFGMGWYTSTHMVVNFVLNVIDFTPDYVVFHEAWNDQVARNTYPPFRNDYGHALQSFQEPNIPDKLPIRASIIYRYVKQKIAPQPDWMFLDVALVRQNNRPAVIRYDNPKELYPYERNIRTIIDLGMVRGITTVLTTQPHSTDLKQNQAEVAPHIDQCNAIIRKIADEYHDRIVFIDLDSLMTGKMNEVFVDIGHVDWRGDEFKARQIGLAILEHRSIRFHRTIPSSK
jgi:hypothetical protein